MQQRQAYSTNTFSHDESQAIVEVPSKALVNQNRNLVQLKILPGKGPRARRHMLQICESRNGYLAVSTKGPHGEG